MTAETTSDRIAELVRARRHQMGWNRHKLAEECARLGAAELTHAALTNIESGRRHSDGSRSRLLTADEVVILARALNVAPHVIAPNLAPSPIPPGRLTDALRPFVAPSQLDFVVDLVCKLGEERA